MVTELSVRVTWENLAAVAAKELDGGGGSDGRGTGRRVGLWAEAAGVEGGSDHAWVERWSPLRRLEGEGEGREGRGLDLLRRVGTANFKA